MIRNYLVRDSSEGLVWLLGDLMDHGIEVPSRNGLTRELPFIGITLNEPWNRELLVPGRKHNLAAQIAETMWVLAGRNDVEWLSNYLPRAADYSDDGQVWRGAYGPRIRGWRGVDQLRHVVELLRSNKDDRRAIINIYDPEIDTKPGKDIPCNNWLHFLVRGGKLNLHVSIRSNDVMWGWSGINAFEWSVLQEIVARLVDVEIGQLHFSVSSMHLYEQHWEKAAKIASRGTAFEPTHPSPWFSPEKDDLTYFEGLIQAWFQQEERIRTGSWSIGEIERFPEPMMRSWLWILVWWWTGNTSPLERLEGTRLTASARLALQPPPYRGSVGGETVATADEIRLKEGIKTPATFLLYVNKLHAEKHAAYGDSWKKRGEQVSILANIARKIDRLGGTETADETSADTAIDLLVYLAKYRWWMAEEVGFAVPIQVPRSGVALGVARDEVVSVGQLLEELSQVPATKLTNGDIVLDLKVHFEELHQGRRGEIKYMLPLAFELAQRLWSDASA